MHDARTHELNGHAHHITADLDPSHMLQEPELSVAQQMMSACSGALITSTLSPPSSLFDLLTPLVTPFDVFKTRIQAQVHPPKIPDLRPGQCCGAPAMSHGSSQLSITDNVQWSVDGPAVLLPSQQRVGQQRREVQGHAGTSIVALLLHIAKDAFFKIKQN